MHPKSYSIFAGRGSKSAVEHAAQIIFTVWKQIAEPAEQNQNFRMILL